MITVVPTLRIAPTDGNIPLRTFQNRAHSAASVENRIGSVVCVFESASEFAAPALRAPRRLRRVFQPITLPVGTKRLNPFGQARLSLHRTK
jgi:hypothetical protein